MQGTSGPDGQHNATPLVIAPGNYDGVHRGHQALLQRARDFAEPRGLRTRVLTFDPHPTAVVAPERAPIPLTTPSRRRELLLAHGADEVRVQPFDRAFAAQTPEAFVERLLGEPTAAMVVGHDFRFGARRAGDVDMLRRLGDKLGFEVFVQGPVHQEGERVSSSGVREALASGDVEAVARAQGHVHDFDGEVVRGDGRGAGLGFATANLDVDPVMKPADGVYAVLVRDLADTTGTLHRGVANIGVRPTFGAGRSVEAHLLDFDGDLYGARLRVGWVARIRGEQRFDGVQALRGQLERDCGAAAAALDEMDGATCAWI